MSPSSSSSSTSNGATAAGTLSLVVHAAGLVVVYSLYSVLQEKIMKTGYSKLSSDVLLLLLWLWLWLWLLLLLLYRCDIRSHDDRAL
jgi:hypothetical protein